MTWWEQAWIGHTITILALVVTQGVAVYLIGRQVAAQAIAQREHELWKVKYDAYVKALETVTRYFYSREWKSGSSTLTFKGKPPTAEEYGHVYSKLRLLTDRSEVVGAFMAALGVAGDDDGSVLKHNVQPNHLRELIRLLRADLGKKGDPTPPKDFALIDFNPSQAAVRELGPPEAG